MEKMVKKMDILLSICIPTYNRGSIVYECVKNCLKNDIEWIEVVVTDNCSSDDTRALLETIDDRRFKYIRNDETIGVVNVAKTLHDGSGLFRYLLGDEDDIADIDWERLKTTLEDSGDVAIFQPKYIDEHGRVLLTGPLNSLKAHDYKAYDFIFENSAYAAGLLIKGEIIDKVWDDLPTNEYIWTMCPHMVLAMYCVKYGKTLPISCIKTIVSNRNDTLTKRVSTETTWPYWSLETRIKYSESWIKVFEKIDTDTHLIQQLKYMVLFHAMKYVYALFFLMKSDMTYYGKVMLSRMDVVNMYKKMSRMDWIKELFRIKRINQRFIDNSFDICHCKQEIGIFVGSRFKALILSGYLSAKMLVRQFR